MPTFGFSAFLKLLSLNDRPQRRIVRERMSPRSGTGYDFHRSLKQRINRLLVEGVPTDVVIASLAEIVQAPERRSAEVGINNLLEWRTGRPSPISRAEPITFESPLRYFKVTYDPNFSILLDHTLVPTHVYNTQWPSLNRGMTYLALSLVRSAYERVGRSVSDIAVLSLRNQALYRLSEVSDVSVRASRLIDGLDLLFEQVRGEIGPPSVPGRPPSPPPP